MKLRRVGRKVARRGVLAVLFAVLLPLILMMATLTVDLAMMTSAKAQLQTAADAAALAGAAELVSRARLAGNPDLSVEMTSARDKAVSVARANLTLNQPTVVDRNDANASDGDVVIGYLDPTNPNATLDTSAAMTAKFNSVQVTARRTADRNGLIPAAFGRIMGYQGYEASVTSTATAQQFARQFNTSKTLNTGLIPIALDQTTFDMMMNGKTSDNYTFIASTGSIASGADGLTESNLYPNSTVAGNWGTVRIGVTYNASSTLVNQIENGVSTDVMAPVYGNQMTATLDQPISFGGNPGISLGMKSAIWSRIGQNVTIPIFSSVSVNGSNASYTIVRFADVTMLDFTANGSHSTVTIQPGGVVKDASAEAGPPISWDDARYYNTLDNRNLVHLYLSR